ncbi:adenosine deaminase [Glycomyces xiaoerkulensis]|uniref:adenosine deaminase n=1 Tax=Glycomyces xiaoerkulensis TaxID=2038139 RepID=UPI000C265BCA|nr:adenosine deaminase [Glycomyces xiaoerkulensis]
MNPATLTRDQIRRAPKVLLHEHLDGGLRPETLLELAHGIGYKLPADTPEALADWFFEAASSGKLTDYLETFKHTLAVSQTAESLHRIASESAQDLAADGVVYAEVRYAPEQQQGSGLKLEEVVEASLAGFAEGIRIAAESDRHIQIGLILCGMRHADRVKEIAELAVRYRDDGVVGFDIAGGETGNPPTRHLEAFEYLRAESMPFTIHAGESEGLLSVWEAVQRCGTLRLGHGVRLDEDITRTGPEPALGPLAAWVRDRRIALEMCPTSNLQTKAAESIASHPIKLFHDLGFRVTVNTDNRLMSRTSLSREFALLSEAFGWGWNEIERCTVNAMKSAFLPHPERRRRIEEVLRPAYKALEEPPTDAE